MRLRIAKRLVDAARRHLNDPSLLFFRANDPAFIIIGAQKSGTSSLFHWLCQHPNMRGSVIKEVHYFNTKIHYGMDHRAYRRHFRGRAAYHFEATPAYMYHPGSCENMYRVYPNIKLIAILRNPVDRAYSAYNHYRSMFPRWRTSATLNSASRRNGNLTQALFFENREEFPSFRECIDLELEISKDPEFFEPSILRRGIYLPQLQKFTDRFGRDKLLIVGFKDLTEQTPETLDRICLFLGAHPFDWSQAALLPQHQRPYVQELSHDDRVFLESYYKEPNDALFQTYGTFNW